MEGEGSTGKNRIDKEILTDLIENKMTRKEIIDIELNKNFENWKDNISLLIKYE